MNQEQLAHKTIEKINAELAMSHSHEEILLSIIKIIEEYFNKISKGR